MNLLTEAPETPRSWSHAPGGILLSRWSGRDCPTGPLESREDIHRHVRGWGRRPGPADHRDHGSWTMDPGTGGDVRRCGGIAQTTLFTFYTRHFLYFLYFEGLDL